MLKTQLCLGALSWTDSTGHFKGRDKRPLAPTPKPTLVSSRSTAKTSCDSAAGSHSDRVLYLLVTRYSLSLPSLPTSCLQSLSVLMLGYLLPSPFPDRTHADSSFPNDFAYRWLFNTPGIPLVLSPAWPRSKLGPPQGLGLIPPPPCPHYTSFQCSWQQDSTGSHPGLF